MWHCVGAILPCSINDKVNVKSIICMPKPIIEYSKVHLPGTNILRRSHLSQISVNYFQIFNKSRELSTKIIDTFEKEVDYENEEEFPDFKSLDSKHGKNTKWFPSGERGEKMFDTYKDKHQSPFKVRTKRDK